MATQTSIDFPSDGARARARTERGDGLLAQITAGLAAGGDLSGLLQRFLGAVVRLAGAQGGAVRLLDAQGSTMRLVGGLGMPEDLCTSEQSVDRHCGHCGAAADSAAPVWAADLRDCASRSPGGYFGQRCQRLLAVPLQHRGDLLGVYNLFFEGQHAEPPPDVMALLRSVGELLGLALHNAKLERAHLEAMRLQERQAMAAEVHDSLGQSLTFIKMRVPLLEDALRVGDDLQALQYCVDLRGAARQAHASLRSLLTHFRTPMDPQGLAHALEGCAEAFRRNSSTQLECCIHLPDGELDAERGAHVFHIVQEALSNVARHAAARHARLRVGASAAGEVEVLVEDDGTGVPRLAHGSLHYGIEIMTERARRLGGTLEVAVGKGGCGTRVRLAFPLPGLPAAVGSLP